VNVSSVCRRLEMSRQNYYARRRQRQRRVVNGELVVELVSRERRLQPRLGTRKLYHLIGPELAKAGVSLGRDRLYAELRQRDLLVKPLRTVWPRTTHSYHSLPVFGNLLKDQVIEAPNRAWVSDITYLRTREGFLYLSLITDRYSRKVVGWHIGENLETEGCLQALERALGELPPESKPIHHSDRGCQYCSHEYVGRLQQRGLTISMTETDHCAENALAERMNGIFKQEYGLGVEFATKAQARAVVPQGIHLYNTRRPHSALGYRVPSLVHEAKLN
jgi:putative transposase